MKEGIRKRLAESIEAASGLADGLVEVELIEGGAEVVGAQTLSGPSAGKRGEVLVFSEKFACLSCGTSMPEIEPRIFSFNSPHGACERCHGLGFQQVIDPELCVPDPTLSIAEGALSLVDGGGVPVLPAAARGRLRGHGVDVDAPWQDLSDADRQVLLDGTGTERHTISYKNRFGRRRAVHGAVRGDRGRARAPLREHGLREDQGEDRGPDGAAAVPGVRRRAAPAREPRGDARRPLDRRVLEPLRA